MYTQVAESLSAEMFPRMIHYLEAVRERKRMCYYASCWRVAEAQRREALSVSMREESHADFVQAERAVRWLVDTFAQRLSLPLYDSTADATYATTIRDGDRRSLRSTDTQLSILKDHATASTAGKAQLVYQ